MKIVAIRDIKANIYGNPVFVASLPGAIRAFGDEVTKTDGNPLSLHPEDYELYHLGEFIEHFDSKQTFSLLEKPVQLALGSNFKK